jgi:2-polyprenyl-3-methyl-5-hydroxy-6-metoxy-1,4-benzoquinol methylase
MRELCKVSFGAVMEDPAGLVRIHPPRTQAQLSAVHATEDYFEHPYFEARRKLAEARFREKHVGMLKDAFGAAPRHGAKLLDIGCDTGALLVTARDVFGLEVSGVEVSTHSSEVGRTKNKLDIKTGDIFSVDLPKDCFDAITMIDVVEHLSEPGKAIERLKIAGGFISSREIMMR